VRRNNEFIAFTADDTIEDDVSTGFQITHDPYSLSLHSGSQAHSALLGRTPEGSCSLPAQTSVAGR
jgi:hypothetical protein